MDAYHYSADWREGLGDAPFELLGCANCDMKYHRYVIDSEAVSTVYGSWADAMQARRFEAAHVADKVDRTAYHTRLAKLVLRLRHLAKGDSAAPRLLDFGCGDGAVLRMARAFGFEAAGIDVSASRSGAARNDGYAIHADFEALDDASPAPFDAIVLSQVLEHVAAPLDLLQALRKRLSEDGVIFVAVPDTSGVAEPHDFHQFTLVQPIEHINAFTPATLRAMARRSGLTPVRRPSAFVTTRARDVMRSAANYLYQPRTTDVFFKRL
jgi:2-polyprenyl-3-methyl-5-hydroxy-6-metoxy-1,4-benzoquinol methylase